MIGTPGYEHNGGSRAGPQHLIKPQEMREMAATTPPMATPEELNARTADFYDANPSLEDDRLRKHRIEFEVTLRTILSVLPPESAGLKVLDIGGGTGIMLLFPSTTPIVPYVARCRQLISAYTQARIRSHSPPAGTA